MSKISNISDELIKFLERILPDHKEHFNPYLLEENDSMTLEKGYSFFFGPADNTAEMASCMLSVERQVVVNLSLRVFGAKEDRSIRREVEKALLEDQFKIIKEVENDPTLQPLVELISFVGDNGVELIFDQEASFIAIKSTFNFRYYEQL